MSYKIYTELLDLNSVTDEPTESPHLFYTFLPTMYSINNNKNNKITNTNNNDIILIAVFSSFFGLVCILFLLWCKKRYKDKRHLKEHNFYKNRSNYSDDNFGTELVLDDV